MIYSVLGENAGTNEDKNENGYSYVFKLQIQFICLLQT